MNQQIRAGRITSSGIGDLMSNGKAAGSKGAPFYTYISECNMERRLGRAVDNEVDSKATSWGKLCEKYVLEHLLSIEYKPCSSETIVHPKYDFWAGSPDVIKYDEGQTVGDNKAPLTLKSFCQLVDPFYKKGKLIHEALTIDAVRENHNEGDKFFYQLVSNAILTNSRYAELIVFVPYKHELQAIRELVSHYEGDQNKLRWLDWTSDDELPYLIEGGHYKNLNIIRFEVSQDDKAALTKRVVEASKLLTDVNVVV